MPRSEDAAARLTVLIGASGIGTLAVEPPEGAPLVRWPSQAPLGSAGSPPPPGLRGELLLSERPPGDAGLEVLARSAEKSGCAALALCPPPDRTQAMAAEAVCAQAGIALVWLKPGLSLPEASDRLARELASERVRAHSSIDREEPLSVACRARAVAIEACLDEAEPPGVAATLVRVAAVAYRGRDGELTAGPPESASLDELFASLPLGTTLHRLSDRWPTRRLASLRYAAGLDRQLRERLKTFAAASGAVIGLSDALRGAAGPDALAGLADHAGRALELGAALFGPGRLASYDNVALYLAYLDDGRDEPLLALSARTLERIKAHDDETGEGLYRTLESYFRNGRNARRTAAELGIQRKTLKKRLAHVEALTDYPVDAEGRLGYELALAMRHWTRGRVSR